MASGFIPSSVKSAAKARKPLPPLLPSHSPQTGLSAKYHEGQRRLPVRQVYLHIGQNHFQIFSQLKDKTNVPDIAGKSSHIAPFSVNTGKDIFRIVIYCNSMTLTSPHCSSQDALRYHAAKDECIYFELIPIIIVFMILSPLSITLKEQNHCS